METLPIQTGYAPANGIEMYYEIHGAGQPLILIHGGFGLTSLFAPLVPLLAPTRQVIVVELQAHGHTADIDRAFSYEQFADDIAALITHLELGPADVLGNSLGGGVALQVAIRHPDLLRKLIVVSAPFKRSGWFPDVLAGMAQVNGEAMRGTPMHAAYASVAPQPQHWTRLADKTRTLLAQDYDWTEAVAAITAPTLIMAGDADSIAPAHAADMFALLGGGLADAGWDGSNRPASQLAVLPGTTHYSILFRTDLLPPIITAFLDAPIAQ